MSQPTYLLSLWFRWKSLRLPWRKKWLAGHDLRGHTFWEFKDPLNKNRFRRIVQYPRSVHYADVAIPPAWLQWLRHTRAEAPSIEEQQLEVQRQANMRQLAARADERWRRQGSFLDAPEPIPQARLQTTLRDDTNIGQSGDGTRERVGTAQVSREGTEDTTRRKDSERGHFKDNTKDNDTSNPWKLSDMKGPSEGWQPKAWQPARAEQR